MRRAVALFVAVLCSGASVIGASDPGKDDLKKLQGKWQVVSQIRDGKPLKVEKGSVWSFSGNRNLFGGDGKDVYDVIKLDASKTPRWLDFNEVRGIETRKGLQGIYEIDGDSLKLCVALPGNKRPKTFESKENSGHVLTVLKRITDK